MKKARLIILYISLYIIALFIVPSYSQNSYEDLDDLIGDEVVIVAGYADDVTM